jgi:hypothetical protein
VRREVVNDRMVLTAFDQRHHPEHRGRRRARSDQIRAAAQPDLQSLTYLVFDGEKLVAAFVMRDDAEHWIEDCGNHAMKVLEMNLTSQPPQPKKRRRSSEKTGGGVPRRR